MSAVIWERTPDKATWRAARGPILLTVSKLSNGMFRADIDGPEMTGRSPECRTRLAAQGWAERAAGAR